MEDLDRGKRLKWLLQISEISGDRGNGHIVCFPIVRVVRKSENDVFSAFHMSFANKDVEMQKFSYERVWALAKISIGKGAGYKWNPVPVPFATLY